MKAHRLLWLLLVVGMSAGKAAEPLPDIEFLEFLGGLESDDDWEGFFDSLPDEAVEQQASTETEDDELE